MKKIGFRSGKKKTDDKMAIKIKKNGEIDVKKLTQKELEAIVDIKLDIAKAELKEFTQT